MVVEAIGTTELIEVTTGQLETAGPQTTYVVQSVEGKTVLTLTLTGQITEVVKVGVTVVVLDEVIVTVLVDPILLVVGVTVTVLEEVIVLVEVLTLILLLVLVEVDVEVLVRLLLILLLMLLKMLVRGKIRIV